MKTLREKFDIILQNNINGNLSEYRAAIRKMKKTTLIRFLLYLEENGYSLNLSDILRALITKN